MKDLAIKYIEHCAGKIEDQLLKDDVEEFIKDDLRSKLRTYSDILEKLKFQYKTSEEKQAVRIQWVASQRKRGKPIDSKLMVIELYDRIRYSIPYIEAISGSKSKLLEMCNRELEKIDFSYLSFGNRVESRVGLISELNSIVAQNEESIHPEAVTNIEKLLDYLQNCEA